MSNLNKIVAILVPLLFVSCERDTIPPKAVIDQAINDYIRSGTLISYSVTNHYPRQVKDEQFEIVEFNLEYYSAFDKAHNPGRISRVKESLAFVKRGNSWHNRQWRE